MLSDALTVQSRANALTYEDIANYTGRSKQSINKKPGIEKYAMQLIASGGRPRQMFHPDVLSLWGIRLEVETQQKDTNRTRADFEKNRKVSMENEAKFIDYVLDLYLSQASRKFVRNATLIAAKTMFMEEWARAAFPDENTMAEYFYKRRITRNDRDYVGYAYRNPSWEQLWEREWKKSDVALKREPTMRYDWLSIGESAGILAPGKGAGTIWVIDDHKGDSFLYNEESKGYKGSLPNGLYMMDGWTGNFIDFTYGEVNSAMVAYMILRNVARFGLPYGIALENSSVMKNDKLDGIIGSLYSDELLKFYKKENTWFDKLFPRSSSPIFRNLPNIPRAAFKARLERLFQEVKLHDAVYFPDTYTGGGIDQVQKRVSNMPMKPSQNYNIELYKESMTQWLNGEYLDKIRTGDVFAGFQKRTKLAPTVRNVWEHYGGLTNAGTGIEPDTLKFGECLFWISQLKENSFVTVRKVKAEAGRVVCTIDRQQFIFADKKLLDLENEKIHVVFMPDMLGNQYANNRYAALVRLEKGKANVLNICEDRFTRHIDQVEPNRIAVQQERADRREFFGDSSRNSPLKRGDSSRNSPLKRGDKEVCYSSPTVLAKGNTPPNPLLTEGEYEAEVLETKKLTSGKEIPLPPLVKGGRGGFADYNYDLSDEAIDELLYS